MLSYIMKGVLVIGKLIQKKVGFVKQALGSRIPTVLQNDVMTTQAFPVRITITTAHPVVF